MPTLLDPDHVAALMSPGIDAGDLVLVIEREEDWLANDPVDGIGQLVGERVDTIWVTPGDDRPLLLRRPTAAVEVVDGGVALAADDVPLLGGTRSSAVGAWRGPTVAVTSTPSDQSAVERVLLELVRLTLSASPYAAGVVGRPRLHPPGRPGRDSLAPGPVAVAAPRREEHAARAPASRADG